MFISAHIKRGFKVIGYIAGDSLGRVGGVEEECIIAGTEELMKIYLRKLGASDADKIVIRKIRFKEIMDHMFNGTAYAFDQESYDRFLPLAEMNDVQNLPSKNKFLEEPSTGLDFVAIKSTTIAFRRWFVKTRKRVSC